MSKKAFMPVVILKYVFTFFCCCRSWRKSTVNKIHGTMMRFIHSQFLFSFFNPFQSFPNIPPTPSPLHSVCDFSFFFIYSHPFFSTFQQNNFTSSYVEHEKWILWMKWTDFYCFILTCMYTLIYIMLTCFLLLILQAQIKISNLNDKMGKAVELLSMRKKNLQDLDDVVQKVGKLRLIFQSNCYPEDICVLDSLPLFFHSYIAISHRFEITKLPRICTRTRFAMVERMSWSSRIDWTW